MLSRTKRRPGELQKFSRYYEYYLANFLMSLWFIAEKFYEFNQHGKILRKIEIAKYLRN